jgi:membrane protein
MFVMSSYWTVLKKTALEWWEDKAQQLGAALSFYTMLSLAPLVLLIISIAGMVVGREQAQTAMLEQAEQLVSPEGAEAISEILANSQDPGASTLAVILGGITLLVGATGVFGQLQDSLNTIWEVEPKPGRGIWGMIEDRFLSFAMVLGILFLLLVSLALSAGISTLNTYFEQLLPDVAPLLLQAGQMLVSLIIFTLLFAMMFKLLPDVKMAWSDVWVGALMTAVLFTIGKFLIGLYVAKSAVGSTYGAAGSFVVLLIWVYYSSQILFFGAEFTQVYANTFGSRTVPAEDARRVSEASRQQQGIPRRNSSQQHPAH